MTISSLDILAYPREDGSWDAARHLELPDCEMSKRAIAPISLAVPGASRLARRRRANRRHSGGRGRVGRWREIDWVRCWWSMTTRDRKRWWRTCYAKRATT